MRMITVSVGYADILALTLPRMRKHFDEVLIVTDLSDDETVRVAGANDANVHRTNVFYENGARFAKWAALERGLDHMGREGWITIADADIIWPEEVHIAPFHRALYSPHRRMMLDVTRPIPPESEWSQFPLHAGSDEFAGYSFTFHASDPALGAAPWFDTTWSHCGGADSFFAMKWPPELRHRPLWECLHLGEAGVNWLGRASQRVDGTVPEGALEKRAALQLMLRKRFGKTGDERFKHEKIQ